MRLITLPTVTKLNTSKNRVQVLKLESWIRFSKYLLAVYREIEEIKIKQARHGSTCF